MRAKISELMESKSVLENSYISQADATWQDEVKKQFFGEHIAVIRSDYNSFVSAMEGTAGTFENVERVIRSLM
ncbi:MAG: hypothetical protein FWG84_01465 [Bacteroidales bacterium]|nr:hypothetical protein [Bacteroidales bacterium]